MFFLWAVEIVRNVGWAAKDDENNGYCLRSSLESEGKVQTGELVEREGIRSSNIYHTLDDGSDAEYCQAFLLTFSTSQQKEEHNNPVTSGQKKNTKFLTDAY